MHNDDNHFCIPLIREAAFRGQLGADQQEFTIHAMSLYVTMYALGDETDCVNESQSVLADLSGITTSGSAWLFNRSPWWRSNGCGPKRYELKYRLLETWSPSYIIVLPRSLVLGGGWAELAPAARRVYLILRAHELCGHQGKYAWVQSRRTSAAIYKPTFVPASFYASERIEWVSGHCRGTVAQALKEIERVGLARPMFKGDARGLVFSQTCGYNAAKLAPEALRRRLDHVPPRVRAL